MATYKNGSWKGFGLATDQRRTDSNPYGRGDFVKDFPNRNASDWEEFFPTSNGGFNFITNADGYQSWTKNLKQTRRKPLATMDFRD